MIIIIINLHDDADFSRLLQNWTWSIIIIITNDKNLTVFIYKQPNVLQKAAQNCDIKLYKKILNLTNVSRTASSLAPMYLFSSSGPYKANTNYTAFSIQLPIYLFIYYESRTRVHRITQNNRLRLQNATQKWLTQRKKVKKGKGAYSSLWIGNPSQSYGASPAIWDNTVLPATQHRWMHPALTPVMQAGTQFTYPGGMEG